MKRSLWIAVLIGVLVSGSVLAYVFIFSKSPNRNNEGPSPVFAIRLDPNATQAVQGGQVNVTVTVTSQNSFYSTVFLRVSGNPSGISVLLVSETLIPPQNGSLSTVLSLLVDLTVLPGDYDLLVSGSGGGLASSATLTLSIMELPPRSDFFLAVSPTRLVVVQGQSDSADVTVTSANGFDSDVTLTVTNVSGVNGTFPDGTNRTSVRPPVNGSLSVQLTVGVSASTTPGSYTLTITASNNTHTRTRPLQLTASWPPVRFTLDAWSGGWNSSNPDPSTPCSPSGTSTCNPDLQVLTWQKFEVTVVGSDPVTHNLAYYPEGYGDASVSVYNPDALNRSSEVYQTITSLVYIFPAAGTYEYYCEYHVSTSHGRILVAENLATLSSLSAEDSAESVEIFPGTENLWWTDRVAIAPEVRSDRRIAVLPSLGGFGWISPS